MAAAALAAAASVAAAASASPVTSSFWAGTNNNGGLGGSFAFLNSGGQSPFVTGGAWVTGWSPTDVVYSATFGGGLSASNAGSWDGSSLIATFGLPDTTSYGETFTAPSASLTSFNFLIDNLSSGTDAKFVVAGFSGQNLVGGPLFVAPVTVAAGGYTWTNISGLDVPLTPGDEYIAFLTEANVAGVPEPATWAMLLVGVGAIGAAMRTARRRDRLATAVA